MKNPIIANFLSAVTRSFTRQYFFTTGNKFHTGDDIGTDSLYEGGKLINSERGIRLKKMKTGTKRLFFIIAIFSQLSVSGQNTFPDSGAVGIGTLTPWENLTIVYPYANGNTGGIVLRNGNYTDILSLTTDQSANGFVMGYSDLRLHAKNGYISFSTSNGAERMRITQSGYVGIGTFSPGEKLEVGGKIKSAGLVISTDAAAGKVLTSDADGNATWQTASSGSAGWGLNGNTVAALKTFGTVDSYDLPIITNGVERMRIAANGNVSIGTTNAQGYTLAVDGNSIFTKIRVKQSGSWPDYVFSDRYLLMSLNELEKFIQKNRHLPEVPTASEVTENGLDVADNQAMLLKKIEELTLHLIEQGRKNEEQSKQLSDQGKEISRLRMIVEGKR